jgi:hypothetical protein
VTFDCTLSFLPLITAEKRQFSRIKTNKSYTCFVLFIFSRFCLSCTLWQFAKKLLIKTWSFIDDINPTLVSRDKNNTHIHSKKSTPCSNLLSLHSKSQTWHLSHARAHNAFSPISAMYIEQNKKLLIIFSIFYNQINHLATSLQRRSVCKKLFTLSACGPIPPKNAIHNKTRILKLWGSKTKKIYIEKSTQKIIRKPKKSWIKICV